MIPINFSASLRSMSVTVAVLLLLGGIVSAQPAPIARYTFDDGSATDSSGNGLNGTLQGAAAIVDDATTSRGKVLELSGAVTDFVTITDTAGLLNFNTSGTATVAAWVFGDDTGTTEDLNLWKNHNAVFSQGEWNDGASLSIKGDTTPEGQLWAVGNAAGGDAHRSDIAVPNGEWAHIAATWNFDGTNTTITFYINGQPTGLAQGTGSFAGTMVAPVGGVSRIGLEDRNGDGTGARWAFEGRIDDLQIFDKALNQAEIAMVMDPTPPPNRATGWTLFE